MYLVSGSLSGKRLNTQQVRGLALACCSGSSGSNDKDGGGDKDSSGDEDSGGDKDGGGGEDSSGDKYGTSNEGVEYSKKEP